MTSARLRILAAAEKVFGSEGLNALTIRRVAAEVGLTPMAIYRHYPDKDALIEALVSAGFGRWEEMLGRAVADGTPRRQLENALIAYRDFALAEPRFFKLMFLTPREEVPRAPDSLMRTPSPSFGKVIAAVTAEIGSGGLPDGNPAQLILLIWATAHGLIALHFTGRFGHEEASFRNAYAETVLFLLGQLHPSAEEGRRAIGPSKGGGAFSDPPP